jgi:hypothetical protein
VSVEVSDAVVGLAEDADGPLDRPPGPGQAPLVDRQLVAAGIDRLAESIAGNFLRGFSFYRQVGQLLADRLESSSDVIELSGHRPFLARRIATAKRRACGRGDYDPAVSPHPNRPAREHRGVAPTPDCER